jgi:vancomycin resistance protein YoaR
VSRSLSVVFEYRGEEVYASGLTLATWLTVREEQGRTPVINREKVAEFLRRTVSAAIDDAPRNSRFAMKDGVLTETAPGVPGSGIRLDDVVQSLEQEIGRAYLSMLFPEPGTAPAITTKKIRIPVAFVQEPPRITAETIAEYNIKDLVGSAATSYRGSSASRRHNIKVGVERVSGLLIAPGEEFSLVKALGEVSEETGFEKEYVIKGDRSVKEAGGGLCQLATTVFRAALNAGLPITERQNHSYVVGYYGPGLDATIYGPWPDLRFVNDTGEYLLFQMKAQGDTLSAEFYGQKDGRQVTLSEPRLFDYIDPPPDKFIPAADKPWGVIECTDQARKGLSAEATYSVRYPSGEVQEKVFKSVYQPWPKICLVGISGPGTALPPALFKP